MPIVAYSVSMPQPTSHLLQVTVDIRGIAGTSVELVLPVWTPGSYKIRDYARHVQDFSAGGLPVSKVAKNRWRIRTGGRDRVAATYRVYAFDQDRRGAHLDEEHVYLNGAAAFMYLEGHKERPVTLELRTPRGWRIATGLRPAGPHRYAASDYDELVDCPIEAGTFKVKAFRVRGVEHRLVLHGPVNRPLDRITRDLSRIVSVEAEMFGGLPYSAYTFVLHTVPGTYGGLEHRNSCSLMYSPFGFRKREEYENFLELAAHEFFHLWNVKRIRPAMLGPFDYEREVHTTVLWALEGLTSYYDGLFLTRAKLTAPKRYLRKLARRWQAFVEKPGRRHQTLSESSFDAWIKYYQPDEHSPNATISYYEKGEFIGLCLDMEIRRRTNNHRSLDDVLRKLYDACREAGSGLPESEWRRAAEDVAGGSLASFWRDYIDGTRELDLEHFLRMAGLRFRGEPKKDNGEKKPPRKAWIGAMIQTSGNRLTVSTVRAGSPAERAGLCARDEILSLAGSRVDKETWEKRLEDLRPGQAITLEVFRGNFLKRLRIVTRAWDDLTLSIVPLSKATALQKAIYRTWMGEPWRAAK
ncbi:MAG: M61 family metallopeptidase [Planctomycetes bacterium]|nr:M61 family metallopeptidase [Planctomycetota bacterium]